MKKLLTIVVFVLNRQTAPIVNTLSVMSLGVKGRDVAFTGGDVVFGRGRCDD